MELQNAFAQLRAAHEELWSCCEQLPVAVQQQQFEGKWSALQNIQHITKGVAAYSGYVQLDHEQIAARFGRIDRDSYGYDDLIQLYTEKLNQGAVSTARFLPDGDVINLEEERLKGRLLLTAMIDALQHWTPAELDTLVCPHPVLGNMTAREMLFFTIFHAHHHTRAIQRIAAHVLNG